MTATPSTDNSTKYESPLDRPLTLTEFDDRFGKSKTEKSASLREISGAINQVSRAEKDSLPLWKLGIFGAQPNHKGCYRTDENLISISGIESDYDAEEMSPETAAAILREEGVAALIYASPSHTPEKPRWRVLCPCSTQMEPSHRASLVARLNGLLGGVLAGESFTQSQSYYYGKVSGSTDRETILLEGRYIDQCANLDAGALYKKPQPKAAPGDAAPILNFSDEDSEPGLRELARYCAEITHAEDGGKHAAINRASYAVGGLVGSGSLTLATAESALHEALEAIRSRCKDYSEACRTMKTAFADGMRQPLEPTLTADEASAQFPFEKITPEDLVKNARQKAEADEAALEELMREIAKAQQAKHAELRAFRLWQDADTEAKRLKAVMLTPGQDETASRASKATYEAQKAVADHLKAQHRNAKDKSPKQKHTGPGETGQEATWKALLQLKPGRDPAPYANDYNAAQALRNAPQWQGRLQFNEFALRVEIDNRPMVDDDALIYARWAQEENINLSKNIAFDALVSVAREFSYHPLRTLLAGLEHDGVSRIEEWLIKSAGAEDTALNRAYSRRYLIAMVARARLPGCKFDHMLILEGPQNIGKSTVFETIAFESEWFTDDLGDISKKDGGETMAGKWVVEMAELDSLSKKDSETAKAFISRKVDRFRPAYGRIAQDFKRQGVLGGTVNPGFDGYLKDPTGARRYWPVACGMGKPRGWKIDVQWLRDNRGQLMAEAVVLFEAGEAWHLEKAELEELQRASAEERSETDPWSERVESFIDDKEHVTACSVLSEALHIPIADQTQALSNRVGRILRRNGWEKTTKRFDVNLEDGTKTSKPRSVFTPPRSHTPRAVESAIEDFATNGSNVFPINAGKRAVKPVRVETPEEEMARLLS